MRRSSRNPIRNIERQADGADCWIIEGNRLPLLGSGSAGALTIDHTGEARRFEEIAAQAWSRRSGLVGRHSRAAPLLSGEISDGRF
jgi:hypothetical protein